MRSSHSRPPSVTLSALGFIFNDAELKYKLVSSCLSQWGKDSKNINGSSIYLLLVFFNTGLIRDSVLIKDIPNLRFLEL